MHTPQVERLSKIIIKTVNTYLSKAGKGQNHGVSPNNPTEFKGRKAKKKKKIQIPKSGKVHKQDTQERQGQSTLGNTMNWQKLKETQRTR